MEAEELSSLVAAAASGENHAWERLVEQFSGLIWSVAASYGLGRADAADVAQVTWLRLVEHLGRLKDPTRVGAWLVTTARRECLGMLRAGNREIVTDDERRYERAGPKSRSPESQVLENERARIVWRSFQELGARCQELLRALLFAYPAMSYNQVAEAFGMPIGSIGPTRARCLDQLRRKLGADVSFLE
ncbi:MAG TPA: sigma-70 family RNA polymerase sigma factor [Actinomycetes bacterium]|jgi:RNA polymerase sigma factor (sigma-70 family)|nr:sigma-70 family RNA polymerase sigma factor [Actinomycetes bacterium]